MSRPEDFVIENGVLTKYIGSERYVTIPDGVTSIDWHVFHNHMEIVNVSIPDSVTEIGQGAFWNCQNLAEIVIPGSVHRIGGSVFEDCIRLKRAKLLNGVTEIGDHAFCWCAELIEVDLPDGITEIGDSAFLGCTGLGKIDIPDGINVIGDSAFLGCTGLKEIKIPNSIKRIAAGAFCKCTGLKKVYMPICKVYGYGALGKSVFENCPNLQYIEITGNCSEKLNSMIVPENATVFVNGAFSSANSTDMKHRLVLSFCNLYYTETTIEPSTTEFYLSYIRKQRAQLYQYFDGNPNLFRIMVEERIIPVTSVDDIISGLNKNDTEKKSILIDYKDSFGDKGLKEIEKTKKLKENGGPQIKPFSVAYYKKIFVLKDLGNDQYAINKYKGNDSFLDIPEMIGKKSVVEIGIRAFEENKKLTEVKINGGIKKIGYGAFKGCTKLKEIDLPNCLTDIQNDAFNGCKELKEVMLPDSVTSIGNGAFEGCTGLTHIEIPNRVTFLSGFSGCTGLTEIVIPDSVTEIGYGAFRCCTGLTHVEIPSSVTGISYYAFYECEALKSVSIPDSVTKIDGDIFYGCNATLKVKENSYAHKYAQENELMFELI